MDKLRMFITSVNNLPTMKLLYDLFGCSTISLYAYLDVHPYLVNRFEHQGRIYIDGLECHAPGELNKNFIFKTNPYIFNLPSNEQNIVCAIGKIFT